jgi:hypothetical protein
MKIKRLQESARLSKLEWPLFREEITALVLEFKEKIEELQNEVIDINEENRKIKIALKISNAIHRKLNKQRNTNIDNENHTEQKRNNQQFTNTSKSDIRRM